MANNEDEAPVVISETEARAGVTGHHVRYVLAFGLAGSLIAFVVIALYYGYDRLTQTIAEKWAGIDASLACLLCSPGRHRRRGCRTSAWPVGYGGGTQSEYEPKGDALAGGAAICCNLSRHGRPLCVSQILATTSVFGG
jgi:hypothetical protein